MHLSDVMDRVCSDAMKDYVMANYKSSGRPTLFRLTTHDGNMNPEMSDVDISPNPDLNDKLSFHVKYLFYGTYGFARWFVKLFCHIAQCNSLVEDHEDDIVSMFAKNEKNPHGKFCVTTAGVCPQGAVEAIDDDSDSDAEPYDFEREEL